MMAMMSTSLLPSPSAITAFLTPAQVQATPPLLSLSLALSVSLFLLMGDKYCQQSQSHPGTISTNVKIGEVAFKKCMYEQL